MDAIPLLPSKDVLCRIKELEDELDKILEDEFKDFDLNTVKNILKNDIHEGYKALARIYSEKNNKNPEEILYKNPLDFLSLKSKKNACKGIL